MKDVIQVVTFVFVVIMAASSYFGIRERRDMAKEIKAIKESSQNIVNFDSILSAREKVFLDSLNVVRESLEQVKTEQRNENRQLRRQNQALEKRFRDLDLGVRPEF